jgi:phosphate transport system permease protein
VKLRRTPSSPHGPSAPDSGGPPPARRRLTRHDVVSTVVATVAAVTSVIILRQGLGKLGTLTTAIDAYVVFAATLLAMQLVGRRKRRAAGISRADLDAPTAGTPAVGDAAAPTDVGDGGRTPVPTVDGGATTAVPAVDGGATTAVPAVDGGATTAVASVDAGPRTGILVELAPPPPAPDLYPDDRPQRRRLVTRADLTQVVLAALAATAIAGIIRAVWGLTGPTGTTIWWYLAFLLVFYVLTRDRSDAERALDRLVTTVIWSIAVLVTAVLGWMIIFLLFRGLPTLSAEFFTSDLSKVGPLTPGGGAFHAIVGTVEQVGIAIIIVIPLAVLTAVYLHEMKGILAKPVRVIVDAMSGLPSIVAGLLVFTVWVDGRGFSGIAGSMALVVLMLPTVTRASEEILRTIPDPLREASLALGAPQWRVVMRVVLPTARAGLVTAVILGIARGVGETAPMLLTAFGSDTTNLNPFNGPQEDLPLFVWKLIRLPNQTQIDRGFAGLLVLVLLVLVLFVTARYIASRSQRKLRRA